MATPKVVLDLKGIEKMLRAEPQKGGRWLTRFAESIVTDIKLSFGTSPSQPGNPPGVDSGTLRASIRQENTGGFERTISDGVEYGVWLEDGTERVRPRPFFKPAFERAFARMEKDAADNLGLEDV